MIQAFVDNLEQSEPILFDGAIATELYKKGVFINRCFEEICLSQKELLSEIHRSYLDAGADVLTTNTWGANFYKLRSHNLHDRIGDINTAAAQIAREVAGKEAWVAGSIGPLGVPLEPLGSLGKEEAQQAFAQQASLLHKGEVDCLILETFTDPNELELAIKGAASVSSLPIIATLAVELNGEFMHGGEFSEIVPRLLKLGVSSLGFNCSIGPQPILTHVEKLAKITSKPICVQPNAGLPKMVDGRYMYMSTPEYFAHFAKQFCEVGVKFIGGCCGSSPDHIRAMANALRSAKAHHQSSVEASERQMNAEVSTASLKSPYEKVPYAQRSKWAAKIAAGQPVTSIELLPPPGFNPSKIIERSRMVKDRGVDAINIPDGPRASSRMSAIMTAILIEERSEIETVLHYTCRDRNLLGIQSDLLGAQAVGLRNLLLVTGDPPKIGDFPNMTGVFDIDAVGLTNLASRLNSGFDLGNKDLGGVTEFSIGVGVNPAHRDFEYEMKRFAWKVDAGAEWAITQPVFDISMLEQFLRYIETKKIKIPIVAGVWPLLSHRNALFMHNEVPGISIPDTIMEKMSQAGNAEEAKKIGVDIARDMVSQLQGKVEGFQVSAPFGRIDLALNVLDL